MHRRMKCFSVLQAKVHCAGKWKFIFSKMKTCYSLSSIQRHCASSDQRNLHLQHCPKDAKSWCRFMHNHKNRTNSNKYATGLPLDIITERQANMTSSKGSSFLSRYLDCYTQNQTEDLNYIFWCFSGLQNITVGHL